MEYTPLDRLLYWFVLAWPWSHLEGWPRALWMAALPYAGSYAYSRDRDVAHFRRCDRRQARTHYPAHAGCTDPFEEKRH